MNDEVMVSVCCWTYNHEAYIRDALEGFVNQEVNFKYEVIIHDDASSDSTVSIINQYQQEYPEIIRLVIEKENQYSKGVSLIDIIAPYVRGKYVAFCEGDDYWTDKEKLQQQVDFLETNYDYSACVHNSEVLYLKSGKKEVRNDITNPYDISVQDILERISDGKREPWQMSSLLFRKKLLYEKPDYMKVMKLADDLPFALMLASNGIVRYFPQIMSVYRCGTESSLKRLMDSRHDDITNQIIDMFVLFDSCTDYHYADYVENCKMRFKFAESILNHDIKKIKSDERMRKMYHSLSLKAKIKMWIDQIFIKR